MSDSPIPLAVAVWGFLGVASGAVLANFAAALTAQRKLFGEGIMLERTKWRDKVRGYASDLDSVSSETDNNSLWRKLALNLNPSDSEDEKLTKLARKFPRSDDDRNELTERFAVLLKHDWDRSKVEASWFPFCADRRAKRRSI